MTSNQKTGLASQAFLLTLGHLIAYAGNLLVSVILVRMISVADYGTFLQVNLVFATVLSLAVFGLPASLFYFIPQLRTDDIKRFVVQNLVLLLMIGVGAAGVLYACKSSLAAFMNNSQVEGLIGYVILLLVLGILNETTEPVLISIGKADMVAKLNIAAACGLLLFVPVVLWLGYGLEGLFVAMAAQYGFKLAVVGVSVSRFPGAIRPILRAKEIMEQWKYVAPIGSARVLSNIKPKVDQFMISYWYPPEMFAVYARGAFSLPVAYMVVGNVSDVLLPKLVQLGKAGKKQEMFDLWQEAMKRVSLFTVPLFVFFLLYAEEVIVFLFTDAYRGSALIFAIYLCSLPMELFYFGHLHQAFGFTRHILLANILTFPLTILLNVVFHALFGFTGPAIAWVVTKGLTIFYHLAVIRKYFSVSFFQVFPWAHLGKMLGLCLLAGAVSYPLKWLAAPNVLVLAAGAVCFAGLYLVLLEKFGCLSSEVKTMIMERLPMLRLEKWMFSSGVTRQ
mgnify:CR=1 FL=1